MEDLTDFPLAEVAVRKCSARRYLTITFALLGEGEVNQNANVCEPGGGGRSGGLISMRTSAYGFFLIEHLVHP